MSEDVKYMRADGFEVNKMPDGYVVYQPERDKVHYLNPTAAMILELCAEPMTADAIAQFLQETYALPEPPTQEVRACLDELSGEEILLSC